MGTLAFRGGLCVAMLAAACSSGGPSPFDNSPDEESVDNAEFPAPDWTVGDAAELGFDPATLDLIAAEAAPETACLLVVRHGQIAGEWYWNGYTAETTDVVMSVTQAYSATLVGIAQDEGFLDVDDPVADYIPEWAGTPSEGVTIRDILSHVSGRESTNSIGNAELHRQLLASSDPGGFARGLAQVHEPGAVWSQNLPAIELLNPILQAATGEDPATFAATRLFEPIGATNTRMGKTAAGVTWMHSFLETTCRDAARLGHLYLQSGNWNGTQVVSPEWVDAATHPSQDLNAGWGYMWWLNRPGSLVSVDNLLTPDYDEPSSLQLNPDAPEEMLWAIGFGGRYIQIDPASDTVVVRLGGGDEATNMRQVTRIVTEALTEE